MSPKSDRTRIEALAEKFIKKGRMQEAITEYRKLLTGDDQDISVRNILGDLYIKADEKGKAVGEFGKIADFYEDRGLYSTLVDAYEIAKEFNREIDMAKKYKSTSYLVGLRVERLREPLERSKQGLQEWLDLNKNLKKVPIRK